AQARGRVSIVIDPADRVAAATPVQWAAKELLRALTDHGMAGGQFDAIDLTADTHFCIVTPGNGTSGAESLAMTPAKMSGRSAIVLTGGDARGLVYGLLEIANRVRHGDLIGSLTSIKPTTEQPANSVRSITRLFVSDKEDKPWYNDRE